MLQAELLKTKRSPMAYLYVTINCMIPVLIFLKDFLCKNTLNGIGWKSWTDTVGIVNRIVLFFMQGFYLTYSLSSEYQHGTITNNVASLVHRGAYLMSKIIICFLLYTISLVLAEILIFIGAHILYSGVAYSESMKYILWRGIPYSLLSFLTGLFLLWIIVLQKNVYYPSLLILFVMTIILAAAVNFPLKAACMIPWSAVLVFTYLKPWSCKWMISGMSILGCTLFGILGAIYLFKHQDI